MTEPRTLDASAGADPEPRIVVLPPASWAEGAADLLEHALYVRSMTIEDAEPVERAIREHLNERAHLRAQGGPSLDADRLAKAMRVSLDIYGWDLDEMAEAISAEYARLGEPAPDQWDAALEAVEELVG